MELSKGALIEEDDCSVFGCGLRDVVFSVEIDRFY